MGKLFGFIYCHLFLFAFALRAFDFLFKVITKTKVREIFPMFSTRSFSVSGLIFKLLIHFGFIFVYGTR